MKLSAEAKYALRAAFDMAYHDQGEPSKAEQIAQRECIPEKFLEQILRKMKAAGLVQSRRGPKGGYFLRVDPESITVGDVVNAIEGPCSHDCCYETDDETIEGCELSSKCITAATWRDLAAKINQLLESVTVADMCRRAERFGIKRAGASTFMYMI